MLLKNIKTKVDYEVHSDIYNSMDRATKGLFQVINKEDFVTVPDQIVESNLSEENKMKNKKKKPKK